jgi:hypothetical protein
VDVFILGLQRRLLLLLLRLRPLLVLQVLLLLLLCLVWILAMRCSHPCIKSLRGHMCPSDLILCWCQGHATLPFGSPMRPHVKPHLLLHDGHLLLHVQVLLLLLRQRLLRLL